LGAKKEVITQRHSDARVAKGTIKFERGKVVSPCKRALRREDRSF